VCVFVCFCLNSYCSNLRLQTVRRRQNVDAKLLILILKSLRFFLASFWRSNIRFQPESINVSPRLSWSLTAVDVFSKRLELDRRRKKALLFRANAQTLAQAQLSAPVSKPQKHEKVCAIITSRRRTRHSRRIDPDASHDLVVHRPIFA